MPTTQPRLNVVLERPLMEAVRRIAERDGVSMSAKARDLIREAVEIEEDAALEILVSARIRKGGKARPWSEVKKRLRLR